jgi:hypothetical protein
MKDERRQGFQSQDALRSDQRLKRMYEVLISHEAEKYYKRQNKDMKRRVNKEVEI